MRHKLLFIIIGLIYFVSRQWAYAQDPQFTQFYANPLYLNPAFAGVEICPRAIVNHHNQWTAISGQFVTYSASYDQDISDIGGGVGILTLYDRAGEGTLNTINVSGLYAYHLQVNRYFAIRAGFQVSYQQHDLDWDKLRFGDQIDPRYGFIYETSEIRPSDLSKGYPDFSSGLLGYTENFFGGVAVHHLTQPNNGFTSPSRLPIKLTLHGGAKIPLQGRRTRRRGQETVIMPNILYQQQQDFQQFNYGVYLSQSFFVIGLWVRQSIKNPDAFILLAGYQQTGLKFGYSYDLTISRLSYATGGSHEFSLILNFPCREKKPRRRPIQCPSF